jgi:SAM-dependent methyltransferase
MTNRDKPFTVACSVIDIYQQFLAHLRYGSNREGPLNDKDHYGFIPKGPEAVIIALIKAMDLLKKHKPEARNKHIAYKFLDAGCGAGNIMLLANCLGFDVWGIERDEDTIKLARKLFHRSNKPGHGIIKANIVSYKDYGEYDVVYYYQPMHGKKMDIFVNALFNQMKVGAIVLAFGGGSQIMTDKRFKQHKAQYVYIYRKTKV